MKHTHTQFELPAVAREVFNLAGETTVDGERIQKESQAAAERTREAKEIEQKQQSILI